MTAHLWLILFIVFSILHLISSWADDRAKRRITKPFLLLFLLLYYVFSAENPSVFLILALFFSWLGDVLLMPKGHHWFAYGGIAFICSHVFFMDVYLRRIAFADIPWILITAAALLYSSISLKIIRMVKDTAPRIMVLPMYVYLLCNSVMNLFALMQLCSLRSLGALTAFCGAVLFFVSDCTLFLVRYYRRPDIIARKHFTVMLAYLLGEFLIVAGTLMLKG